MKIYLASFLETQNFGEGRVIGIANGSKPSYIKCDMVFPPLIPTNEIMAKYNNACTDDQAGASNAFVKEFSEQLEAFCNDVQETANKNGKTPEEILPFMNGDTLASWERENFKNYRPLVGAVLTKLGYKVILH